MNKLFILKEDIQKMVKLYKSGLSGIEISKVMGFSNQTVCRRLNKEGIKMRNGGYYSGGQFKKGNIPWKKGQDNRVNIVCKSCNKEFKVYPYRKDTVKVCSFKCRYEEQKGRKLSEETKKRLSISHKLHPVRFWLGKKFSKEKVEKNRLSMLKVWDNPIYKAKRKKLFTPEIREKMSLKALERCKNPKVISKMKIRMKKLWQTNEYREKTIEAILKGSLKRPTSLEKDMMKIIDKHNLPYKYVGDGSFLIGYKNPDFININGEKKLIEVGNVYHHQGNYKQHREAHFKKYGWKSYFFIGQKLNEDQIINILKGETYRKPNF